MKRNKLILLVILLVLIGAYFVLKLNQPEEKQTRIFDLDSLSIGTIEIYDQSDTLKFAIKDGTWYLTSPVAWAADTLSIQALFKDVLMAKSPKTSMGEGKEAIANFRLKDNQALHIIAGDKKGKKRIHTMFSNMGNPYDYFRYYGSNKVYQIKSKVARNFSTELSSWRSPTIVHHYEEELLSIDVVHPKNSFTLTRKGYEWFYKDAIEAFPIPPTNRAIMKVVNILANMDTYIFIDDKQEEYAAKFAKPDCTVTLHLVNNQTQVLTFVKANDDNYLLMVDGDASVLFTVTYDTFFRFIRHAAVFREVSY